MIKRLLIILVFAAGLAIFLWPVLIEGKIYTLGGITKGDLLAYHFPNYKLLHDSLNHGYLPLWTSKVGDGFPIMAEGQLGVFYPPNLFFLRIFDTKIAMGLLMFSHLLVAAIGIYLVVYELTRSQFAAVISGFSFSLSGFMVAQLVQINYVMTFSWFPLVFLVLLRIRQKFKFSTLIWLGILMAMQILSGFLTIFYYQIVVIFIFNILVSWTNWKMQINSFLTVVLSLIIAISICAVQVGPTLELFLMSSRGQKGVSIEDQEYFPFPKEGFLSFMGFKTPNGPEWITDSTLAAPMVKNPYVYYGYLGILPLIALPFGILIAFQKKYYGLILCLVWVFLMTLGSVTPVFKLFYDLIPGMKYFRHSIRFLAFVEFFLVILAAFGIAHIELYLKGKKRQLVLAFIMGAVFIDLYYHQVRINPVDKTNSWLNPPEIVSHINFSNMYRVSGYDLSKTSLKVFSNNEVQRELLNFLPANYLAIFNLSSNNIYSAIDILYINPFPYKNRLTPELEFNILGQQQGGEEVNEITLTEDIIKVYQAQGVKYVVFAFPLKDPALKLVWQKKFADPSYDDLLVRDTNSTGQVTGASVRQVKVDKVYLYELTNPLPRVRLDVEGAGRADIITDNGNRLEIEVRVEKPTRLYVADTYYPGWKAYVDGKETQIYRANDAFRAVEVTPGNQKVVFIYEPVVFKTGMLISLGTLALITNYFLLDILKPIYDRLRRIH